MNTSDITTITLSRYDDPEHGTTLVCSLAMVEVIGLTLYDLSPPTEYGMEFDMVHVRGSDLTKVREAVRRTYPNATITYTEREAA